MRRAFFSSLAVAVFIVAAVGCRSGADLSKPETQKDFGVRMARMNLWREAMFRFKRAVEINPSDAMARNNLAVALEAIGDFDGAAREYREALRLDRSNQHIQKNYSRFVEFTQRAKKREAGTVTASGSSTAAPAATTTTTASAAPPPGQIPPSPPVTATSAEPPTDTTTTNPPDGGSR